MMVDGKHRNKSSSKPFRSIPFGTRKVHQMMDPRDKQTVMNMIPDAVLNRKPTLLGLDNRSYLAQKQHRLSIMPANADRVMLVMTRVHGKKMCLMVTQSDVLLLTLVIESSQLFDDGCVMECYLSMSNTGRYLLQISDVFVYAGVFLNDVTFVLRKLIAHVFKSITFKPREKDAVEISVADDFPMCDLTRLTSLYQIVLLHSEDESLLTQHKNKSFVVIDPSVK
jgi:hypothetical protein